MASAGRSAEVAGLCNGVVAGGDAFANSSSTRRAAGEWWRCGWAPRRYSLTKLWQTSTKSKGPPIVAGDLVWTITGSTLYGLNLSTGASSVQLTLSGEANHFPTPAVGAGLLLAPAANRVYAFTG